MLDNFPRIREVLPDYKCMFCLKEYSLSNDNIAIKLPSGNVFTPPTVACKSCLELNVNMKEFKRISEEKDVASNIAFSPPRGSWHYYNGLSYYSPPLPSITLTQTINYDTM